MHIYICMYIYIYFYAYTHRLDRIGQTPNYTGQERGPMRRSAAIQDLRPRPCTKQSSGKYVLSQRRCRKW